jgi:predicted dehydrogenase
VVAVCDSDAALAERVAREQGILRHHAEYEQMLADRAVELVVIATPDHLHGQHAIMALEAGKHVLSEIPMAPTIAECDAIVALAERRGLKYQLGNQVRYAACLQDVRRLIAAGDLGDIFYGEGEYLHDMADIVADRPADTGVSAPHRSRRRCSAAGRTRSIRSAG